MKIFVAILSLLTISLTTYADLPVEKTYQYNDPTAFAAPEFICNLESPRVNIAELFKDPQNNSLAAYLGRLYSFSSKSECEAVSQLMSKAAKNNVIQITVQDQSGLGDSLSGKVVNVSTIVSQ